MTTGTQRDISDAAIYALAHGLRFSPLRYAAIRWKLAQWADEDWRAFAGLP